MKVGNPAFCLALYLTGIHFRGELQHVGDVSEQKNQVLANQNSRNRWCQILRRTICKEKLRSFMVKKMLIETKLCNLIMSNSLKNTW